MIDGIQNNLISSNKYILRFAETEEEVEAAQRLRFEVFNLELGEGLAESFAEGRDVDQYDAQCHHLMVFEKSSDEVIGTYRMQTYAMAQKALGFYTESEYDIQSIPENVLENSVEVGRACIHKDHRNGRVLYLLWRGIAEYMKQMKCRYLFGCCSLTGQDEQQAWEVMEYLRQNDYIHQKYQVSTIGKYICKEQPVTDESWKQVHLPQLFRLYMGLGAKVCSLPAIDREFKTIDYLVLLDIENVDERTRMLFLN